MKIVLLPGLDGTGDLFAPLVAELDTSLDPVIISYPDHELSYGELVDLVMSQLPQSEPYILLGESFSGRIAFEIGLQDTPNLLGVIFVCSFLEDSRPLLGLAARALPVKLLISVGLRKSVIRWFALGRDASEQMIALLLNVVRSVSHVTLGQRIKLALGPFPVGRGLSKPSCQITALHDRLVSRKSVLELAKHCENMVDYQVSGPHFLLQSKPIECSALILDFCQRRKDARILTEN